MFQWKLSFSANYFLGFVSTEVLYLLPTSYNAPYCYVALL